MISVEEAAEHINRAFAPLGAERVPVAQAAGRVLAEDAAARFDQPPFPVSAMDGYALRAEDAANIPAQLSLIGEAPAGRPFAGRVGRGQAVRIFTGGVVPEGADSVVLQEDSSAGTGTVTVKEAPDKGQHVRVAGLDFRAGEIVVPKGRRLTGRDVALIAAADIPDVSVAKKPRVVLVSTGDELSRPGAPRQPGGIVASSVYGLMAMIEQWGGIAEDFGILPDTMEAFAQLPAKTAKADLVVTMGGASVGDHDLVQKGLAPHGFKLDFWKIAMRPGKPLIFGKLKETPLMGLPGNPVSALVCAILFVRPAIAAMLGMRYEPPMLRAELAGQLRPNGPRQDYIRTRIIRREGRFIAEPFAIQDSSMQAVFARSDGLIVRPPGAPAVKSGESVEVLALENC